LKLCSGEYSGKFDR